jgi:hypothetical protein
MKIDQVETLCNILTKTYDSRKLDLYKQDDETILLFKILSEKFYTNRKGVKHVLMNLIYNHYNTPKPTPIYILGPISLSYHYSSLFQTTIYVFGEHHNIQGKSCPPNPNSMYINNFLSELFSTTDVFIDAFLEFPGYTGEQYKSWEGMPDTSLNLNVMFKNFEKCLEVRHRDIHICDLMRIHYIDLRKYGTKDLNPISLIIRKLASNIYLMEKEVKVDIPTFLKVNNTVFDKLNTSNKEEYINYWKSQIDTSMIRKQLEKSFLGDNIKDFILEKIVQCCLDKRDNINKAITALKKSKQEVSYYLLYFKSLKNSLSICNSLIVDAYSLSRMFRTFPVENNQPSKVKNIIYYAGESHSSWVREFLESINFKKKFHVENTDGCLDLPRRYMPFFS